jgi:hypothetical protein
MPVIPAFGKWRQENHEFEARASNSLKKKKTHKNPHWE